MVALDGERRLPSEHGVVRVVEGPLVIDLAKAFRVLDPSPPVGARSRLRKSEAVT
jgi:hypothetical protein